VIALLGVDGTYQEVPHSVSAGADGDEMLCFGERGQVVGRFRKADVMAYGQSDVIAALVRRLLDTYRACCQEQDAIAPPQREAVLSIGSGSPDGA